MASLLSTPEWYGNLYIKRFVDVLYILDLSEMTLISADRDDLCWSDPG